MKRYLILIILLIIVIDINAQYKKASFFNKTGRIYDIGVNMHVQSGERKSYPGFFMSFGKQNGDKHISHWYDMELMLGHKYAYNTTSSSQGTPVPVKVTGNTGFMYSFRYNFVYFFKLADEDETKLLPFVNLTGGMAGGKNLSNDYTISPSGLYPDKAPGIISAYLLGAGGGIVYMFSDKVGLRLSAAYYGLINTNSSTYYYNPTVNHPAIQLALRFRMLND